MNTEQNKTFVTTRMAQEQLNPYETKLVGVRPTKTENKVQLMFMQNTGTLNLQALLNKGDDKWNSNSGRPAWITVTLEGIESMFKDHPEVLVASKKAIADDDYVSLDISNPTINGQRIVVRFNETLIPRASDISSTENLKRSIKQDGNGNYLLSGGKAIFERVVLDFMDNVPTEENASGKTVPVIHDRIAHDSSTTDFMDVEYEEPRSTSKDPDQEKTPDTKKDLTGQEA